MIKRLFVPLLIVVSLLCGLVPVPVRAEATTTLTQSLARDAVPLIHTLVELQEKSTTLNWYEDRLEVTVNYRIFNPTAKKLKLPLNLPYQESNSSPPEYHPLLKVGDVSISSQYNNRSQSYNWNIPLNAGEGMALTLTYSLPREINSESLDLARFESSSGKNWASLPLQTTLSLNLKELHLGQIQEIQPMSYKFQGSSLTWTWPQGQSESLLVKANILKETNSWQTLLAYEDRVKLAALVEAKDYLGAAELFRVKASTADRESRLQYKEVQGYYLEKAGQPKDALIIWEVLYNDKSPSPRVYWPLGQAWQKQSSKILDLYQRVKELQVNPLLQEWLASQLPVEKLKLVAPEKPLVDVSTDSGQEGLLIKANVSDKDGDLRKVIFRYHWEDRQSVEKVIELSSLQYAYTPSLFIPAPGPLQRLFYEVIVLDKTGNQVTSSEKEGFYLNNQLNSQSIPLTGAMLVLADYSPAEQDKVEKWFRSYMKIAREAKFVPVEQRRPYFIFLGQNHDFISQYQGPLFIMNTPAPFDPDATRLVVHRYFLTYWYGPGWTKLPEAELAKLGDGLLLGRGRYVMILKYLSEDDSEKFAALLGTIGQGKGWLESLSEVYKMTFWEAQVKAIWHAYGKMVIAVFLIIGFAWLGKTGQVTRLITYFREKK